MWSESNAAATYPPECADRPQQLDVDDRRSPYPHTCWKIVTIDAISSAVSRSRISSFSSFISPDRTRARRVDEGRSSVAAVRLVSNVYGMFKVVGVGGGRR